jgi:hypothetical protein
LLLNCTLYPQHLAIIPQSRGAINVVLFILSGPVSNIQLILVSFIASKAKIPNQTQSSLRHGLSLSSTSFLLPVLLMIVPSKIVQQCFKIRHMAVFLYLILCFLGPQTQLLASFGSLHPIFVGGFVGVGFGLLSRCPFDFASLWGFRIGSFGRGVLSFVGLLVSPVPRLTVLVAPRLVDGLVESLSSSINLVSIFSGVYR